MIRAVRDQVLRVCPAATGPEFEDGYARAGGEREDKIQLRFHYYCGGPCGAVEE